MSIVVFGAGGRAGRAIIGEARRRGHDVVPVVRDPARHPDIADAVRGDISDPRSVQDTVRGHDAAVHAVSPASGPEQLAAHGLDPDFFAGAAEALLAAAIPRLVVIGLFATLTDTRGRLLLDDPDVFPEQLRGFAMAHLAGLTTLRASSGPTDWVQITPPATLSADAPRTGRYRTGGEVAGPAPTPLSYADLAIAAIDEIDEIDQPRHHHAQVSVLAASP